VYTVNICFWSINVYTTLKNSYHDTVKLVFLLLARYVPNVAKSSFIHDNNVHTEDRRPTDRPRIL